MHSHIVAHQTFAQSLVSWLLGILDYSSSFRALLGTLLIYYSNRIAVTWWAKEFKSPDQIIWILFQIFSNPLCVKVRPYFFGELFKKMLEIDISYVIVHTYMEFLKSGLLYKNSSNYSKKIVFNISNKKKFYFQDHCFWKFLISQEVAWVFPEVPDQNLL